MPYYPYDFNLHDYINPILKFTYDEIYKYSTDRKLNMFFDFYDEVLPPIINENPDYIGISIGSYSQVIPGLTMAKILKEKTNGILTLAAIILAE
ncbi:MAG: hypothetical protein MZU97_02600 [Bacillus subtilis]|nr:hypothetical protein [Bacillus subtilis]